MNQNATTFPTIHRPESHLAMTKHRNRCAAWQTAKRIVVGFVVVGRLHHWWKEGRKPTKAVRRQRWRTMEIKRRQWWYVTIFIQTETSPIAAAKRVNKHFEKAFAKCRLAASWCQRLVASRRRIGLAVGSSWTEKNVFGDIKFKVLAKVQFIAHK